MSAGIGGDAGTITTRKPEKNKINWIGNSLVGTVDVVNCQDGQVTVITEVTQGNAGTGLELVVVDNLLANVEGDWHGEDVAIGKTAVLTDTKHRASVYVPSHFIPDMEHTHCSRPGS